MDELFRDGWPAFRDKLLDLIGLLLARALPAALVLGKGLLTRAERREIIRWLVPLENLVRSFIMFATLELPPGTLRPERERSLPTPRVRPRDRVPFPTFRIMPPEALNCGGYFPPESGVRADPMGSFQAWPLVQRLENALDALDNPEPHMRRLAKRFERDPSELPKPEARSRTMGELAEDFFLAECREHVAKTAAANTS